MFAKICPSLKASVATATSEQPIARQTAHSWAGVIAFNRSPTLRVSMRGTPFFLAPIIRVLIHLSRLSGAPTRSRELQKINLQRGGGVGLVLSKFYDGLCHTWPNFEGFDEANRRAPFPSLLAQSRYPLLQLHECVLNSLHNAWFHSLQ